MALRNPIEQWPEHWPHECEDPDNCESCRLWRIEQAMEWDEYDERERELPTDSEMP
jgi:hypothetical protein